jgi:hypothetical protein
MQIVGLPPGCMLELLPGNPYVVAVGRSLHLKSLSIANAAFTREAPVNPITSLGLAGIEVQDGAAILLLQLVSLGGLDCAAWMGLVQAICDFGWSPGNAQFTQKVCQGGGRGNLAASLESAINAG